VIQGFEPAFGIELGELDGRLDPGLDALGQRHLLRGDQQGHATDLTQVHAHGVGGARAAPLGRLGGVQARPPAHRGRQAARVGPVGPRRTPAGEQHDGGVSPRPVDQLGSCTGVA
jgi:hypothetical protein